MKKSKLSLLSILLVVAMLFGMVGCSSGDSGTTDSGTTDSGTTDSGTTDSGSSDGGDTSADVRDSLVVAINADITTLDPTNNTALLTALVSESIYDTLFIPDFDGNPVESLASSYEFVSDTEFQVTIRDGILFHDGTTMTADDVAASLTRAKDSTVSGSNYTMISSIEVVDGTTVKIILNEPYAPLLTALAHHSAAILPKAYIDSNPDFSEPVGSGAFIFKDWIANDSIELVKNPNYFKTEAMSPFETLSFRIIPEAANRTIALEAGEVDLVYNLSTIDINRVNDTTGLAAYQKENNQIIYAYFNVEKEPYDDALVRQAFNHLIDKEAVRTIVYNGYGGIMNNVTPAHFLGYNEDVSYDFNPEKAKELLQQAGVPDNHVFTVLGASGFVEQIAQIIQGNLTSIGYGCEIDLVDWSVFHETTGKGDYEITIGGVTQASDPDRYFYNFLHTDAIGVNNRGNYSNPALDALINEGRTTLDQSAREGIYADAYRLVMEDAPWVPLWTGVIAFGAADDLDLSAFASAEGSVYFNYIKVK